MARARPPAAGAATAAAGRPTERLDKWLWHARFFRTRAAAAAAVEAGGVRLNGRRAAKPAQPVGIGDTLTFVQGGEVRLVRVLALAARRGPTEAARALYAEVSALPAGMPQPAPLE